MGNTVSHKMRTPSERVSIAACSRILGQVAEPDKLVQLCYNFIIDPSKDNAHSILEEIGNDTWLLTYLEPPFERWSGIHFADTIPMSSGERPSRLE